ncbi:MAG TPA: phosphatidate cytidylyltransferase [Candidatus Binataceae bacterium]|nr:phosphatidate cytidylyltransferase [Candidatus Binataceae bacterium]
MTILADPKVRYLLGAIVGLLLVGSIAGRLLQRRAQTENARATADNLVARTRAWWAMILAFVGAEVAGAGASAILFGLISFAALREMLTLTLTRRADHHTLFAVFFLATPIQYWLVYTRSYGLFAIFIPVYAFLWVCIRSTVAGDYKDYLGRVAKIYFALMIAVYFLSHAAALLDLDIPNFHQNINLLFFLAIVVQFSDVMQYVWGKLVGAHKVAPHISPNKTWEGLIGGALSAAAAGTILWWMTPFRPWQAASMSLLIVAAGFGGGIVMSAVKRDAGIKDYGRLIPGHGGMMDRIDSLCFAAPVFFHLTRYFFALR